MHRSSVHGIFFITTYRYAQSLGSAFKQENMILLFQNNGYTFIQWETLSTMLISRDIKSLTGDIGWFKAERGYGNT